jgi:outer membrane immunogenic protein
MRKFLLSGVAFAALAGQTLAADLPSTKGAAVYVAPPAFSWTGFYVGVNAGYAWGDPGIAVVSAPVWVNTYNFGNPGIVNTAAMLGTAAGGGVQGGFIGGGQVGYNYQMGSVVLGLEADIMGLAGDKATLLYAASAPAGGYGPNVDSYLSASNQVDWLGTVRARIGYTIAPTLLAYVTGGFAYGGVTSRFTMTQNHIGGPGLTTGMSYGSTSSDRGGWTVGGGAEWAFAPNWTLRAEYLYFDLGDGSYAPSELTSAFASGLRRYIIASSVTTAATGNIVRAGLNYKFGGPDYAVPVVAKY